MGDQELIAKIENIIADESGAVSQNELDSIIEIIQCKALEAGKVTGETSDGYHTFNELYEYRKVYNAMLFNEWSKKQLFDVHKSRKHSDGEPCFGGGWFIVVAELPTGQISNHYEMKDWGLFNVSEKETPNIYDGHTPQQVLDRLRQVVGAK